MANVRYWANRDDGGAEPAHCKFGSDNAISSMQSALRRVGVLGVSYNKSESPNKPVGFASFILFREGMVTSGAMTSIEYHSAPQPCSMKREGGQGFGAVHDPITAAPCRWFWEHDEN